MTDQKTDILWRVHLMYFFTALFALMILGRVLYIQFVEGEQWVEMARSSTVRYVNIDAVRGDIYADDGRMLATSVPNYEIRMDMSSKVVPDQVFYAGLDSLALQLSRLFGDRSQARYRSALVQARNNQDRYYLIKRNVSYTQLIQLRNFPIFRLGRYKGGLVVVERSRREMPYRTLAARTIGYEREGVYVGLEGAYREYLEGTSGKRMMQRTSGGHWMPINDENEIQPENGMDVITTINVRIQDITENALLRQLTRYRADYGTAVVMEVATGKIKAITNLSRMPAGNYDETYNYAVGESTEPGSTFKLASLIAILEDGVARPDDILHTGDGSIRYADRIMRDARDEGFGDISLREAFELSSNVGISKVIYEAYGKNPQRFVDRIKALGIDQPLGLEISGEGMPLVKDVKSPGWSGVSLPWMAIGYEVSLTPLQTLSLYNAVANKGRMMKPMFVEEIRRTGKPIVRYQPTVINRSVASSSTLATMNEMLIGVVENGTAKNIYTPVYPIAGKTGTAQVAQSRHGYKTETGITYQASFAGYFPADNPQYSCIVVINNPRGWIYTGSQVAAPVFREISDKIFATYMTLPEPQQDQSVLAALPRFRAGHRDDLTTIYKQFDCRLQNEAGNIWVTSIVQSDTVTLKERQTIENLVPDVSGMGLRNALFLLENAGLRVRYAGRGTVRRQSLTPGTRIVNGNQIYLELN